MEIANWRVPLPPGSAHVAVAPFRRMAMLSRLTEPHSRRTRIGKAGEAKWQATGKIRIFS
jgi:hypothetical protein